ncbi:hypothetical protein K3552_09495 [Leisingera aquaemixtae]|uniref:hypothetical protein n=1 Tax=Leisingera aquaemixtae TaxID=1396826 RepID=UPI0021A712C8|nr:hypothetical protein [Leisingera aquaemixtae]UWQ35781.1 hypothetical protein K3552_09495 [Leisingera aquaemixtae]
MRIKIEQQALNKESLFPVFDVVLRFIESGRHSFDVDSISDIEGSGWGDYVGDATIDLIKRSSLSTSYVSTEQNPLVVIDEAAPSGGVVDFDRRLTRVEPLDAIHFLTLPFAVIVENEIYDGSFLLWMAKAINNQSFVSAYRKQRFQFRHAGGKGGLSGSSKVFSDGVWPRSDGAYSRALRLWNGVMLDSDAAFPGHNPNDGIVNACQETAAWVHELQARSIENYLPKEALLNFLPKGDDRTRVYKYFELSEQQRRHYDLKRGFKKRNKTDIPKATFQADGETPAEVRELYRDVQEEAWGFLVSGFGSSLSQIFVDEQHRPNTGAVELPTTSAREEVEEILKKVLRSV